MKRGVKTLPPRRKDRERETLRLRPQPYRTKPSDPEKPPAASASIGSGINEGIRSNATPVHYCRAPQRLSLPERVPPKTL